MADMEKRRVEELNFPEDIRYNKEHTWARWESGGVRIGISDYAQDQLGDLIFVELPTEGELLMQGKGFGNAESAKSVSTLYMPISGEVLEINDMVVDSPELVNQDPYGEGWLIVVKPMTVEAIAGNLLSADEYIKQLKR